jgi:hypothetical protein
MHNLTDRHTDRHTHTHIRRIEQKTTISSAIPDGGTIECVQCVHQYRFYGYATLYTNIVKNIAPERPSTAPRKLHLTHCGSLLDYVTCLFTIVVDYVQFYIHDCYTLASMIWVCTLEVHLLCSFRLINRSVVFQLTRIEQNILSLNNIFLLMRMRVTECACVSCVAGRTYGIRITAFHPTLHSALTPTTGKATP